MPLPDDLDPSVAKTLRDVIARDLPGFELIDVETRRTQPRPAEPAERTQSSVVVISPTLDALKAHYASLGAGAHPRPMPRWNEHRPSARRTADAELVYCRVKAKTPDGQNGAEISVLISLTSRKIIAL